MPAVVALACCVVVVAGRVHRLDLVLDRDEGEYAYIAQQVLRGAALYCEAYTMKLPGVPLVYAAFFACFGESARVAHVAALCADAVAALALATLTARALRDRRAAVLAACAALSLVSLACFDGFVANCEKFACACAAVSFALLARDERVRTHQFAGLAMGCAFVCKQQALPLLVVLGALALARTRRPAPILALVVAAVAPYLTVVAVVVVQGTFAAFWFQTITYARAYTALSPAPLANLAQAARELAREPLVWLALVAVPVVCAAPTVRARWRIAAALWLVGGAAALSIGLVFARHYLVFAVPPLALFIAMFTSRGLCSAWIVALSLIASTALSADDLFTRRAGRLSKEHYRQRTFVDAVPLARELRKRADATERVLMIASEPEVLFLAQRRSLAPYIYFYPLLERQPYADRMQRELFDRVAREPPRLIVVHAKTMRTIFRNRPRLEAWTRALLADYRVVWPNDAERELVAPPLQRALYLLERRPQPLRFAHPRLEELR